MRNGFLFSTARAGALASIAGAPLVVTIDARRAQAVPPGGGLVPVVVRGPEFHEIRVLRFLDGFWQDAWGTTFTPHRSGMMLEPSDGAGPRVVFALDGDEVLAEGRYHELARHLVPGLGPSPDDPQVDPSFSFEHFVTAGIVQGSSGFVKPIYAIAQRVAFTPDNSASIVVEGLTPLGVTDTIDGAIAGALEVLDLLAFDGPGPAGDDPQYEPDLDLCLCDEVYLNEVDACYASAIACDSACAAVAIAAILTCLALGPLAGPCMVAALAAEVLCIAGCLAKQKACNLRAKNQWLLCWLQCASSGR
ncbi:MAG: hypothetical protein ACYSUF_10930 [Planctomycetota bacterium]|jgi:hypothetical protein